MNWNTMTWHFCLVQWHQIWMTHWRKTITMQVYHGKHLSATIAINTSNHPSHIFSKALRWKLFSWVTMSKCKQRHMTLHPNIRSWMSCLQECTSAMHLHCQIQRKKSITLTVTSSDTWISSAHPLLGSRESFPNNTFWSTTCIPNRGNYR